MERIFDPFFTTREVNEGDEISLFIVYSIVQKSDWSVFYKYRQENYDSWKARYFGPKS